MADYFIGEIICTGFNFNPKSFYPCDGRLLPIQTHTALFSILGTNFGGDGILTFAVPDLRGVVPIGLGAGPGLTPRQIGEVGGAINHTLLGIETPPHSHAITVSAAARASKTPVNNYFAQSAPGDADYAPPSAASLGYAMANPAAIGPSGGGLSHENRQPTLVCMYSICHSGVYPSRP